MLFDDGVGFGQFGSEASGGVGPVSSGHRYQCCSSSPAISALAACTPAVFATL